MSCELIDKKQLSEKINTPVNTLSYWIQTGYGPPSARIGRKVMYRVADVDAWIDGQFARTD